MNDKSNPTLLNKSEVSNTDTRSASSRTKNRRNVDWVVYCLLALVILALIGGAAYLLVRIYSTDAQPNQIPNPSSDGVECFRKTRNGNKTDYCTGDFCFKLKFNDGKVLLNCINGTDPAYDWNGENSTVTPDGTAYKCYTRKCNNSISSAPSLVSFCSIVIIALFHCLS